MVYGPGELGSLDDSEQPDFLATLPGSGDPFGIEVTEFYLSESDARLRNIRGYLSDIFNHGRYRHVVDRESLKVGEVTITPKDGGDGQRVPAIIQTFPDTLEHLRLLAEVIRSKGSKARRYQRLRHLNLVVLEHLHRWGTLSSASLCRTLTSAHIPAAFWRSPYREVFYVTSLSDDRWISVPLGLHCLLAEAFAFDRVIASSLKSTTERARKLLQALSHHLALQSALPVLTRGAGAEFEVLHRRYGLLLPPGKGTVVHDYADHAYPPDAWPLAPLPRWPLSRRTIGQRIRRHHEKHSFECDIVVPAKASPPGSVRTRKDA